MTFVCAVLARIRCLRESLRYALVIYMGKMTVSANSRKTSHYIVQNKQNKSWLAKLPRHEWLGRDRATHAHLQRVSLAPRDTTNSDALRYRSVERCRVVSSCVS